MDATAWNDRYATAELVWHADPNRFLEPAVADLAPGTSLDLACGEGRNALWLAKQGWTSTGVDFSSVGLEKAARLATEAGVEVEWLCADATAWDTDRTFDLVAVFYLHLPPEAWRSALGVATRAVAPGGTLLLVGHSLANLTEGVGGPQAPDVLWDPTALADDLAAIAPDLTVERCEHVDRPTDAGTAIDTMVVARRSA